MRAFNCKSCGTRGEFEPILTDGFEWLNEKPRLCAACQTAQEADICARQGQERQDRLAGQWLQICPPLYRQTDPSHPDINQDVLGFILAWRDNGDGVGFGLHGHTGRCKTRMLFLLLKRLHFEGVYVAAIGAKRLGSCWSRSYGDNAEADESRQIIKRCRNARVLLLDDIGKDKLTDRVEAEFYDLIEFRTSHLMPTHWTANADGQQLEAMMSEDRGGAIVRRLREFSTPIPL